MKSKKSVNMGPPIHIKLEVDEAREGKKDLLSSEVNLLKISQTISRYKDLRIKELEKKRLIIQKSKEIKKNLLKLQGLLPTLKIPKILEKDEIEILTVKEKISINPIRRSSDIEGQLLEIQEKLRNLE